MGTDNHGTGDSRKGLAAEFLIAEYEGLLESFWRTEELGEKRVEFFIALVTAALGAVFFAKSFFAVPGIAAMGTLCLLGILIRRRILVRNVRAREYLRGMGRIRCYFEAREPGSGVFMFARPNQPVPMLSSQIRGAIECLRFGSGGLLQTMTFITCLLGGAFVGLVLCMVIPQSAKGEASAWEILLITLAALASAAIIWCILMLGMWRFYRKEEAGVSTADECLGRE